MICPNCEMRWAPFPEKDFKVTGEGIIPRNDEAREKIREAFHSNEKVLCGCCNKEKE